RPSSKAPPASAPATPWPIAGNSPSASTTPPTSCVRAPAPASTSRPTPCIRVGPSSCGRSSSPIPPPASSSPAVSCAYRTCPCRTPEAARRARPGLSLRPLPQRVLADLPGRGRREGIDELHGARRLVGGDAGLDERDESGLVHLGAGPQHDVGQRPLSPLVIGHAHDGCLGDGLMGDDGLLDLDRRDVLTAGDDDVLGAVEDLHIAVRVHHGEVPGVEPPAAEG